MSDVAFSRGTMQFGRGVNARTISVKKIGKGMFSTAYLGTDGRVYLVTKDDGGDYAKEILAMIYDDGDRSPYIPPVKREGMTNDASVFSMPLYKAPLRKADSPKAWAQYRTLMRCWSQAQTVVRKRLGYRERMTYYGYDIMVQTVECAEVDKDATPGLIRALELLRDAAANYGSDWSFEFAPRNLATTKGGNLVLLDALFSMELVERRRKR